MTSALFNGHVVRRSFWFTCALIGFAIARAASAEPVALDSGAVGPLAAGMQPSEAAGQALEEMQERGRVVIFASERVGEEWIGSFFSSLPSNSMAYNQCELSLGEAFRALGYETTDEPFTQVQKQEAKKHVVVFGRYRNMSSMANDTAVRASSIVDASAGAVVLCAADVGARRGFRKKRFKSCAEVKCKAISTENLRRLATHSIERCAAGPGEAGASVEALRSVCSEAGRALGEKLTLNEGNGS